MLGGVKFSKQTSFPNLQLCIIPPSSIQRKSHSTRPNVVFNYSFDVILLVTYQINTITYPTLKFWPLTVHTIYLNLGLLNSEADVGIHLLVCNNRLVKVSMYWGHKGQKTTILCIWDHSLWKLGRQQIKIKHMLYTPKWS